MKKTRRDGQIIAKGDFKFQVRAYLGAEPITGKRRYYTETFRGTRKDAEKRLREIHTRIDQNLPLKDSDQSFDSFLDEWLLRKSGAVRARSFEHYRSLLALYVIPYFTGQRIKDITAGAIEKLYAELEGKGLSSSTRKYVHVLLNDLFKLAAARDLIRKSPMLTVKPPASRMRETRAMGRDQVIQFLKAIEGSREEALFKFAFFSGARPAEYLSLKWSDIDEQKRTVTFRHSIVWNRRGGDWQLTDPKTKSSIRTLPLSEGILEVLADHRRRQLEERMKAGRIWKDHGFVFADEAGGPMPLVRVRYLFKKALKAAGLPDVKLYVTRHTAATTLLEAGANMKVVQERLGHSNVATTMTHYATVTPRMQNDASDILERVFSG